MGGPTATGSRSTGRAAALGSPCPLASRRFPFFRTPKFAPAQRPGEARNPNHSPPHSPACSAATPILPHPPAQFRSQSLASPHRSQAGPGKSASQGKQRPNNGLSPPGEARMRGNQQDRPQGVFSQSQRPADPASQAFLPSPSPFHRITPSVRGERIDTSSDRAISCVRRKTHAQEQTGSNSRPRAFATGARLPGSAGGIAKPPPRRAVDSLRRRFWAVYKRAKRLPCRGRVSAG